MDTPLTDHLTSCDFEHIYEPAEDSFLLLDALEMDLPFLEQLNPRVCLEIGCGSGVVITALSQKLRNTLFMATDINPYACRATKRTARRNSTDVESIQCNLVDSLRSYSIDLLIFNPPYVVTTDEEFQQRQFIDSETEISKNLVYTSWAGGRQGRRVIDELLMKLDGLLSASGVLYLLLLHENKPKEIIGLLKTLGFKVVEFMDRHIPGEHLVRKIYNPRFLSHMCGSYQRAA